MLSYQKLKVYGKGLAVVASLAKHSAAWDRRHAVVDQLCRAAESIVLNLAEGARLRSPAQKQQLRGWYFAHEPLEVYQAGLSFMSWFNGLQAGAELATRLYRQVDKAATSMILNLAEGYGRTGEGDRLRFLDMAEGSAVKAAAYLDLCVSKAELDAEQRTPGMELLGRVGLMLRALSGSRSE